jgi:hypothetical protein
MFSGFPCLISLSHAERSLVCRGALVMAWSRFMTAYAGRAYLAYFPNIIILFYPDKGSYCILNRTHQIHMIFAFRLLLPPPAKSRSYKS